MMNGGWVKGHRKRFNNPLFSKPYCPGYAWDWLCSAAMIEPTRYNIKGKTVVVGRGQFAISVRRLADEFGWSKSATLRFLNHLKTEMMIGTASGTGQMVITICNYDTYQTPENSVGQQVGQQRDSKTKKSGTASGTGQDKVTPCDDDLSQTPENSVGQQVGQQNQKIWDTKERKKDSCSFLFLEFWAAFPRGRKVGKKKCIATFKAAVKSGIEADHIIQAAKEYAALMVSKRTEQRFIKNSTTWLNQGCWDDELETGQEDGALDNQGIRKLENGMGDSELGGDRGEAPPRNAADDLSGMFGAPEEENRSVPVGDVQAGRDSLELLALPVSGGIVF